MNDTESKTMRVRRESVAAMTTQRGREPTDLHLSLATVFYTPSRASSFIPSYGDEQLTVTVHLHRHDRSSPDASYKASVRDNIASPSPPALGKPRHHHIPLPPQTESDIMTVIHPLLWSSRGSIMMELDFARSLSRVHVLSHEDCVNKAATSPPLPSLAVVHLNFLWPVVI
ncbi:hypothetical protein ARMSODRAFT_438594 [Armillaria solidipes]|uniref:Uncharacterized protein n=1 Tax=Armillaria solidipes TaxID=1076256 RepID=A0A2H3B6C3_9AGAR|nr:hypothetical protein ARMSODRAFT_438594 [Armillaria solidipes]